MQNNNAIVGTNYSHIFQKRGDDLTSRLSQGSFSVTPTDAELDAAFGQTAAQINSVIDPFWAIIDVSGSGNTVRMIVATNDFWFYSPALTKAL